MSDVITKSYRTSKNNLEKALPIIKKLGLEYSQLHRKLDEAFGDEDTALKIFLALKKPQEPMPERNKEFEQYFYEDNANEDKRGLAPIFKLGVGSTQRLSNQS
jgi:hypothetical protein